MVLVDKKCDGYICANVFEDRALRFTIRTHGFIIRALELSGTFIPTPQYRTCGLNPKKHMVGYGDKHTINASLQMNAMKCSIHNHLIKFIHTNWIWGIGSCILSINAMNGNQRTRFPSMRVSLYE